MPNDFELFVYSIIGFFAGIFLFFVGFRKFRQKRLIEAIPTSKVRSIAMGLVEVFGQAVPKRILKSPLTNHNCVYYKYLIQELRSTGKHSTWVTVDKGESAERFYLKDDTGKVLVDPVGANVDIPPDFDYDTRFLVRRGSLPSTALTFLKKRGISHTMMLGFRRNMRFREYYIAPRDKVYVMGTASDNPDVKLTKEGTENIIIKRGNNVKFFYISDSAEKDILKKFGLLSMFSIFGGALLTIGCLFYILLFIGLF